MLRPNVLCQMQKFTQYDQYGIPQFSVKKPVKCSVVRFKLQQEKTSVRADSSASRGRAEEMLYDVILLFPKNINIKSGDRVEIFDTILKAEDVETRLDINGRIDHFEVSLNQWE